MSNLDSSGYAGRPVYDQLVCKAFRIFSHTLMSDQKNPGVRMSDQDYNTALNVAVM